MASAVLLVSAGQDWVAVTAEGARTALTGTSTTGGLSQALAVVPPLGLLLSLTLRARGRRAVGVLLGLLGLGALVLGAAPPRPSDAEVQAALSAVTLADRWQTSPTAWPWVFAAGGLLLLAASALMVVAAPGWPSRAARYETSSAVDPGDPAAAWRALDRGEDPTRDEPGTAAATSPDPIGRLDPGEDTMSPAEPGLLDDRREGRP
nr:Trp biosynthesis-associated membrane protein [Auraticoccus cholistanensis]